MPTLDEDTTLRLILITYALSAIQPVTTYALYAWKTNRRDKRINTTERTMRFALAAHEVAGVCFILTLVAANVLVVGFLSAHVGFVKLLLTWVLTNAVLFTIGVGTNFTVHLHFLNRRTWSNEREYRQEIGAIETGTPARCTWVTWRRVEEELERPSERQFS